MKRRKLELRRVKGRVPLPLIEQLGEQFMAGHRTRHPDSEGGLALEEDFKRFFRYYDELTALEQRAVRAFVGAAMGLEPRQSAPAQRHGNDRARTAG